MAFDRDVVIVGGGGRVGLPLGIAFAMRGLSVTLYDINTAVVDRINAGELPFAEAGAEKPFAEAIANGKLVATADPASVAAAEHVVVIVGTPVDAHLNPDPAVVPKAVEQIATHLRPGQLLVLRSTVHPGVTQLTEKTLAQLGLVVDVAFCPERIAEGHAMTEIFDLPQIIAGRTEKASERAEKLFSNLASTMVKVTPEEAELAKLFTNTWRYVKFATANQFWMMANDAGVDFARVRQAITQDYPRASDLPMPGFAAGPCLFKDTMQLAAFNKNNFVLGHSAMLINEGLPNYVVSRLEQRFNLSELTVGILGMAFKGGSDDIRESLAFKLRKLLQVKAAEVLCADPYVVDARLTPQEDVLSRADLLIIGAPHAPYRSLDVKQPVIDMWGIRGEGVLI
ncbi:nucleotide sugar dehydrogenase [Catelliglobosispora koreensis]|uniref:nucleotide sugar dehydrogenase n=1 Tax=Catelliglobosispora koreensis TaxID=129052 RepID=UPI00037C5CA0|nr:nucleotide sugar dehydrogenase [Catelliglobosispora koreensis]